jgi:hypothetical protein
MASLGWKGLITYFPASNAHFFPKNVTEIGPASYVPRVSNKVMHRVKTTVKIILVELTTISWVSVINKLYYVS